MNYLSQKWSSMGRTMMELVYPPRCASCMEVLEWGNEDWLCLGCSSHFFSLSESQNGCPMVADRVWARTPIRNCYAHLGFSAEGRAQKVIHQVKYGGQKELARHWGRMMGNSLERFDWFASVDAMIPVPIHWRRRFTRGYNQGDQLCKGIKEVSKKEIGDSLVRRTRYTQTQTGMNRSERLNNLRRCMMAEAFGAHIKHVLVVDDVLTTGATLEWMCQSICESNPDVDLSVAVLGVGGL